MPDFTLIRRRIQRAMLLKALGYSPEDVVFRQDLSPTRGLNPDRMICFAACLPWKALSVLDEGGTEDNTVAKGLDPVKSLAQNGTVSCEAWDMRQLALNLRHKHPSHLPRVENHPAEYTPITLGDNWWNVCYVILCGAQLVAQRGAVDWSSVSLAHSWTVFWIKITWHDKTLRFGDENLMVGFPRL